MDALPTKPGKVLPNDVVQVAHGMASSAAAAIVRLGGMSTLFARVGDDAVGDTIVRDLSEAGVDCRFIRRCQGVRSPICTVLVDAAGEKNRRALLRSAAGARSRLAAARRHCRGGRRARRRPLAGGRGGRSAHRPRRRRAGRARRRRRSARRHTRPRRTREPRGVFRAGGDDCQRRKRPRREP